MLMYSYMKIQYNADRTNAGLGLCAAASSPEAKEAQAALAPDAGRGATLVASELRKLAGGQPASPGATPPQVRGESARAFEAFRVYLELGPRRRYAAAARKVGASLRTLKGWAHDFDWHGRIKAYAAQGAEQYAETETAVKCEEFLDAAARAKAFRDRQYAVAEAILAAAERYLTRVDAGDMDQMTFADACKALEVASRIAQQTAANASDDPGASARSLRDQLAALLDQACAEASSSNGAANQSQPSAPAAPQL